MADDSTSSRRRPVSLNDRHYRLLQDLSAPPKQQHSSHYSDAETQETKATMVKLVGRRRLCKVSDKKGVEVDGDNDSSFSDLEDFDSPGKDASKLEGIDGPPGVCCISFRDKPNVSKNVFVDEPMFSAITDFDSPSPPPKNVEQRNNCQGRNEIMDILDDLSSKLGSMSIQKKKSSQRNDLVDEFIGGGIKCAVDDFVDAESSFSSVYAPYKNEAISESLVDKQTKIKDANERRNEYRKLDREFSFVGQPRLIGTGSRIGESKKDTQSRKNGEIGERLRSVGSSNISRLRELEDDDDDDCVVTNDPKIYDFKQPVERSVKSDSSLEIDDEQVSEDVGSITFTDPRSTYSLPGKIATMLFPHQREGLKWLWSLHTQGKGGILGDDMGLGKTMQICSFLAGLFHSKLIKRAMVVAPKTLLPHWIKELTAVGLSEKIREYYGTCSRAREYELQYILQDKGVLLTTYDIVRNNTKSLKGDPRFADDEDEDCFMWDYMILDEGHLIKNPSTQRAKSLLEIPSAHRVIISGTPIQNNLKELWALFNFSCPGLLGDKKWFKEKYEYYILRGNDKNASEREKRIGSTVAKDLREHIQPFFLRRLKSEVFGEDDSKTSKLSKKNEIVVWLRLTSCQRQLYEAFLRSEIVLSAFDGSPLAALTILKKICDHPFLLTKRAAEDVLEGMDSMGATLTPEEAGVAEKLAMHIADVDDSNDFQAKHDSVSCKISFILSLLGNLIPEGHNVLIFSQTRKMLNLLQESLTSNGYKFLRIDGTTKATDRLQIVNDFQEGHMAPIFLLTSQVGGLGLTLTRADRVIVVDPAWNPSTDNQSVDRAYRIGQNKDVIVYRLMTCGTVEEKIYRKQVYKGGLFKTATEHKEQIRYFSQQDMRELFSLPKEGFDVSPTQQQLHEEHSSQIKMDEVLESHVKYLETQGIAGVSHHSLLFSKTAPVQVIEDEPEETRWKGATYMGRPSSSSSIDLTVDGAEYAFNPKDVKLNQKSISPDSIDKDKLTESEIKARIHRLSLIFTNKNTVIRLPDKGAKLQKQIAELNSELDMMRMGKSSQTPHLVDLDDVSGKFQKVSIL